MRKEILDVSERYLSKFLQVVKDIKSGTPEIDACKNAGIPLDKFRNFYSWALRDDKKPIKEPLTSLLYPAFTGWELLYCDLRRKDDVPKWDKIKSGGMTFIVVPDDDFMPANLSKSFKCLMLNLSPKHREVLIERYVEGNTLESIGRRRKITREAVRQIINTALIKLHTKENIRMLMLGVDEYDKFIKMNEKRRNLKLINIRREIEGEFKPNKLDIDVSEVFSNRTSNALKRNDIFTMRHLLEKRQYQIECIKGIGQKALKEIDDTLAAMQH